MTTQLLALFVCLAPGTRALAPGECTSRLIALEAENKELKRENTVLKDSAALEAEATQLRATSTSIALEAENEDLRREVTDLRAELGQLRFTSTERQLKAENEELRQQTAALGAELDELRRRSTDRSTDRQLQFGAVNNGTYEEHLAPHLFTQAAKFIRGLELDLHGLGFLRGGLPIEPETIPVIAKAFHALDRFIRLSPEEKREAVAKVPEKYRDLIQLIFGHDYFDDRRQLSSSSKSKSCSAHHKQSGCEYLALGTSKQVRYYPSEAIKVDSYYLDNKDFKYECPDKWGSKKGRYDVYYPKDVKDGKRYPVISFFHGQGAKPYIYDYLLDAIAGSGLIILAAYSASSGWCNDFYKDGLTVLARAYSKKDKDPVLGAIEWGKPAMLFGHSMGGMEALRAASEQGQSWLKKKQGTTAARDIADKVGVVATFCAKWDGFNYPSETITKISSYTSAHYDHTADPPYIKKYLYGASSWVKAPSKGYYMEEKHNDHTSLVADSNFHYLMIDFFHCAVYKEDGDEHYKDYCKSYNNRYCDNTNECEMRNEGQDT